MKRNRNNILSNKTFIYGFKQLLFILLIFFLPLQSISSTVNLPKTGQTICYDANGTEISCTGTGQDGDSQSGVDWPDPRFTNNNNGTITDNLTGLIWTKDGQFFAENSNKDCRGAANCDLRTWQEALDYVKGMNDGTYPNLGYTDWRLPNVLELLSLSNKGVTRITDWLMEEGFENLGTTSGRETYWSSTTKAGTPANAWTFNVFSNITWDTEKTYEYASLWPVRGGQQNDPDTVYPANVRKTGQTTCYDTSGTLIDCTGTGQDGDHQWGVAWPDPRFTDNGDNTVTDNLTGIKWYKQSDNQMTWQEALDYAASLSSDTGTMRVPNITELVTLLDFSQTETSETVVPVPAANPISFLWHLWSSTNFVYEYSAGLNAYIIDSNEIGEAVKTSVSFVTLIVEEGEPDISVSPMFIYFGVILPFYYDNELDFEIVNDTIEITNTGDETLFFSYEIEPYTHIDGSYLSSNDSCDKGSLEPGESCDIGVEMESNLWGAVTDSYRGDLCDSENSNSIFTTNIHITSNDPDTPLVVVPVEGAASIIDMDINYSNDSTVIIDSGEPLTVSIQVEAGNCESIDGDWWLVGCNESSGECSYLEPESGNWESIEDEASISPTYQGPIYNFELPDVITFTDQDDLADQFGWNSDTQFDFNGEFTLYIAVDTEMDGQLTEEVFYDFVSCRWE